MTPEEKNTFIDFFQGNVDAANLCADLLYVAHLWDDLIDKDKTRTDDEINAAFLKIFGAIPFNPFYQQNAGFLAPQIHNASLVWLDSNVLQTGNENDKFLAFMIRNALLNVCHFCMLLIGGEEYTLKKGPEFWRFVGNTYSDIYRDFLKEVHHA